MIRVNIGCGWRNFGPDWIHIDGGRYPHLQYKTNTLDDLHFFEDNTVDLLYASHVLEYFDNDEVKNILKEWRRVIKVDGIIRIAVPDFESMSHLYTTKQITLSQIIGPLYGKMKMENNSIYHKTVYDFETLKDLLIDNGFGDVSRYDWRNTEHSAFDDHSQAYIPHMDKDNGVLISLNIEGRKCD